ncbi:OmpA family protein [Hydrogenimonas cancrithermarum]|uniref:Membrane protein n=1 Tax=Hydrogenimonas cancrithermarum TaxID=2993563 RepID=A0ABM8FHP6_9BACT|nr:OmpA family protein [Hydrogenimonas cancrithermarum]BDY11728.1 membrane protein [Hydrogenimonas cancrithermarum]
MKKFGYLVLGVMTAGSLMASEYKYSVTPMVGGESSLSKKFLDNGLSLGARIGYNMDKRQSVELGYDYLGGVDYKDIGGDTNVHQMTANYLYHFEDEGEKLRPYLLAGLGAEDFTDNRGGLKDGGIANFGGGLKYLLTETMGLRLEVRDIVRFHDGGHTLAYTAGLDFALGKIEKAAPSPAPAAPMAAAAVAPLTSLDSDGDGVLDSRDKCPNTPSGTIVDGNGCALDSDGDGVADNFDRCPGSKTNQVDETGCPLDSDNDGVPDYLDQCPNTPAGFNVDERGCTVGITLHIDFPTNSSKIPAEFMPNIEKLVDYMKKHSDSKVILEGHTDSVGSAAYNLQLSKRRAEAVKEALVAHGIDASRITVKAFGESKPVASNDTPQGRAQNRRVEALILPSRR